VADLIEQIRDMFRDLDRHRRVLLCHPSQIELVRAAVDQLPSDCLPGLIEVRATELAQLGQVIVCNPNPPQLPPPAAFAPGHPLPRDIWKCPVCRRFEGHKLDCPIGRRSS
jgi:hypothetical protein